MNVDQIGLQLYTVREQTATDMLGTLRVLADMGYRAVEFAGYGGVPVRDLRATLDDYGLRAIGAHVPTNQFETRLHETIDDLRTLGCDYAVVPWVPEQQRRTTADVQRLAEQLNQWAAACEAEGLRFAYHNHAFEFAPLNGATVFDVLTTATDPAVVNFELDVFWAQHGGHDPVVLIERLSGRVPLLHVKDMTADAEPTDAPVGDGVLPWDRILAAGAAAGVEWYIVEQDRPREAMEDARRSLRNLEQMANRD